MCFAKCLYGTPYIVFTVHVHCIAMCFANVSFRMYFWATLGPLVAVQVLANEETVVEGNTYNLQGW